MKHLKFFFLFGALAAAIALTAWLLPTTGSSTSNTALAEYQIDRLTCGSCVSNIKEALARYDGIDSVDINLTSNRGRIAFDPKNLNSRIIGEAIASAGYPSQLRLELTPAQYTSLQTKQAQLGQDYIALIGDRLLSRKDFEQFVNQAVGKSPQAKQPPNIRQSVWKDVLQRELLLFAAERSQIVVQDVEVDVRIEKIMKGNKHLKESVAKRYGSKEEFRKRLREDMIINRNIEENVIAGITQQSERQKKLQQWYAELQKNVEVIILDPQLKIASQSGNGCACCSG